MTQVADPTVAAEDAAPASGGLERGRSASQILDSRQRQFLGTACLFLVIFLLFAPLAAFITVMATTTFVYFAVVVQRLVITKRSLDDSHVIRVSDAEARAIPDADLPIYTVLVPAYREAQVIEALAAHLRAIEYPRDRLDVKLLLEEDDLETIDAARHAARDLSIVLIPPGGPRTKPKALNTGLESACGEYVTIYDAEDVPDPLQLRRAVAAFRRLPDGVACLQAQLTFHNWNHNIITRWFTIEYLMWFTLFLPGLSSIHAPIPLGGTSNHIRRDVLESVGAWDAYNVTEDADLGIRLYAAGWQTEVLESETLEEPNSDFVNWVKQRSRWYKGYLQTWFVHLRHPVQLWRTVGPGGFAQFNLFVGGTPMLSLLNPFFWLLTVVWFTGHATLIEKVFPAPLYHLALFCWIVGNLAVLYVTILGARRSNRNSLFWAACLVPAYWVMMSMAAIKAFWQVIAAPSFWEKTTHGLTVDGTTPSPDSSHGAVAFAPLAAAPRASMLDTPGDATGSLGNGGAPSAWAGGNGTRAVLPPPAPVLVPRAPALEPAPAQVRAVRSRWVPLGRAVSVVGLLVALFVGYVVIGTSWQAHHSQHRLGHTLASARPVTPRVGSPVARIVARRAGLDAIVIEGVGASQLRRAPGHVPGTSNPGGAGNVVIAGHRVAAGGPFAHLDQLRTGDTIEFFAPWGRSRYRVSAVRTSSAGAIDVSAGHAARLTLVTSGGGLDLAQRLVVQARLAGPPSAAVPAAARRTPRLPGPDTTAPLLLLAAAAAALLAWQIGRWLAVTWGRLRAALFVAPFVVIALVEAFTVGVRILPATF